MNDSIFRQQAVSERRSRLFGDVIVTQPAPQIAITVSIFLIVLVVALLIIYGTYSSKVNVGGYLVPRLGIIKIFAPTEGEIFEINVAEGQVVTEGDVLLRISTNRNSTGISTLEDKVLRELERRRDSLRKKVLKEEELAIVNEKLIVQTLSSQKSELIELDQSIILQIEQIDISNERLERLSSLKEKNYEPLLGLDELRGRLLEQKIKLSTLKRERNILGNEISYNQLSLLRIPIVWSSLQETLNKEISEVNQKIIEVSTRNEFNVRSPIDGTVTAVQVRQGQQTKTEYPMLFIVPKDNTLHAELFVPTRSIGTVSKGKEVLLRYDAFPYQHYGQFVGEVREMSNVIISPSEIVAPFKLSEPMYRLKVELKEQYVVSNGNKLPLQAGMLLQGDIILEERSLWQWLMAPLYKLKNKSVSQKVSN